VVHDELAGIGTLEEFPAVPAGSWGSPKHDVNWFGVYDAGMLNEQPCVSKVFWQ
jgi:hypothetical protein